ncbi:hypothetical protein PENTCL1PPCAC_7970, partial [Pristionchus entomophagus]
VLLAIGAGAATIRQRRAIAEFADSGTPSIVISDPTSDAQKEINSYQSILEELLRQLSALEQKSGSPGTSAELLDEYQREYYTQAASEVVQKLIQYGALASIIDAENAAFYEDTDGDEETESADVEEPLVRVGVKVVETAPSSATNGEEEPFTDEQAHEILKMIVDEMMNKFFADAKNTQNTHIFVLGAESKLPSEEETEPESGEYIDEDSSSSSSSSEDDEYYMDLDSDEYDDYTEDNDAVYVVNKQVSTNIIRIPTATFVDALTKLLPTFKTYPAQLQQLTPLQVEDPRVYGEHGDPSLLGPKTGSGLGPETPRPTHVSAHSVSPIASVAPTAEAAAAAAATTSQSERHHYGFDLGHILILIAAALLSLWAIAQLVSMYRRRGETTTTPAPAIALPPKVIPAIIPNIYATPPAVLTKQADPEKPPVYVEKPEV